MKANRTGKYNEPPKIEDLGDGTFYYNFNVEEKYIQIEGTNKVDSDWHYNQVRLPYPVVKSKIQKEVNNQKYKHTVSLE